MVPSTKEAFHTPGRLLLTFYLIAAATILINELRGTACDGTWRYSGDC